MAILFTTSGRVAAAGNFTPSDYNLGPKEKKKYIDRIIIGWTTGTTGRAYIQVSAAGNYYPLVDDYPLTANDKELSINPKLHLTEGMGIHAYIMNAGALDNGTFAVMGVD